MTKKYKVPEGMLEVTRPILHPTQHNNLRLVLEAALQWLAEHPIVPTDTQSRAMQVYLNDKHQFDFVPRLDYAVEWQRRMFLAPEEEKDETMKAEFESWWASTNNSNWFSNKPIGLDLFKETAFYAWRAAKGGERQ